MPFNTEEGLFTGDDVTNEDVLSAYHHFRQTHDKTGAEEATLAKVLEFRENRVGEPLKYEQKQALASKVSAIIFV